MKNLILAIIALLVIMTACSKPIPADLSKVSFIPLPIEVMATGSSYIINQSTEVYVTDNSEEVLKTAGILVEQIQLLTGLEPAIKVIRDSSVQEGIVLLLNADDESLGVEGYQLKMDENRITARANEPAGLFMGIQTLLQAVEPVEGDQTRWIVPSGSIRDYPEYGYRGAMLDVSRHFFGVDVVKRLIDQMSAYKLNTLHLHLSDDQGWRIEIKSWPKLTTIGGSTQVGGGEGGYYTQEDYREIVQYAKDRFITIIPEIDMPGHTNAAYVAYPELNGTNKKAELYTGMKVGFSTLNVRSQITYDFVDDVIRELSAITTGDYIHIGGDESHVTKYDDYVYFINRVRQIVKKYNKKMIGWDEIAHADIESGDVVQYWAKGENALLGKQKGAKVLMSPAKRAYLDMQYDSTTHIGLHWAAYIELDHAYEWEPSVLETGITKEDILGLESPLWTETVVTTDDMDYLIFPRLIGHAEIGWTPVEKRNWDDYKQRLANHGRLLEMKKINFYRSKLVPWK
jgi:hexosaminidase